VDLWAKTEQIWEGVFSAVASIIIMIMGIAFLKMDKSRVKWRLKLADAFEKSHSKAMGVSDDGENRVQREEGRSGKWALFLLPFITLIRVRLYHSQYSIHLPGRKV
jgi:high-affinity iron transporter